MAGFFQNMVKFVQSKYAKMEAEKSFFEDVQQKAEQYIEDRMLLMKLQATEKVALFSPKIILALVLAFFGFFIISIATFLLGYYLTIETDNVLTGWSIVLGIYILLFIMTIWLYKKRLRKLLTDLVVKMILSRSNAEVPNGR